MTRKELIAYDRWLTENKWGSSEIITPEQAADLYLAEHPLPPVEGAEKPNAMKFLSDNGYGSGFNYTTKQVANLMQEFAAQPQPTAEGAESAEAFIKRKHPQDWDEIPQWHIDELNEFAAQQQPTAEGAEEMLLLAKYISQIREVYAEHRIKIRFGEASLIAYAAVIKKVRALHAQRIAEKMVSERCEIAIKALETIHHAYYTEGESAEEQVIDLRSIALKALEEIDNLKTK